MLAVVFDALCSSAQQTGNEAFDHRSAVAAGTGEMDLVGGPLSTQARFRQYPMHVLLGGRRREGFDRVWDAYRQHPARMQRLTQRRVVERQVARQRVDSGHGPMRDLRDGLLDFVDQGQDIALITGVPHRQMRSKDASGGRFSNNPGLATKLRGTITLAFANRRHRPIRWIDHLALRQGFAMGEVS